MSAPRATGSAGPPVDRAAPDEAPDRTERDRTQADRTERDRTEGDPAATDPAAGTTGTPAGAQSAAPATGADPHGPAAESEPAGPKAGGGRLRAVFVTAFVVVAAGCAAYSLRGQDTAEAAAALARPRALGYLAAALALNVAGMLASMLSWRALLAGLGSRLGLLTATRIFFVALLGKYIPGPVWGVLAEVQLGRAVGVPAARMVTAYLLGIAVLILSAFTVGFGAAPALLGWQAVPLVVPLLAAMGCALRPDLVGRVIQRVARLVRVPARPERATRRGMPAAIAASVLSWVLLGLHLWVLALALGAPAGRSLPVCVGGFALATIVGALTLVLPDGVGVREVLLTVALAGVLSVPAAGIAAIASRLCCVATEVGVATAANLVVWARRRGARVREARR